MRSFGPRRLLVAWLLLIGLFVAAPAQAAFPGANGKIAFDRNGEIYTVNPDGSGLSRLTNNTAIDYDPAWSPDGSSIAFVSDRDGSPQIYTMNAGGSNQTRITVSPGVDPAWSPDGNQIAFASGRKIYRINRDGSGLTAVTNDPNPRTTDSGPAWGPNGRIALTRAWAQDNPEFFLLFFVDLFTVNPDGSGLVQVTHMPGYSATCGGECSPAPVATRPTWSPDGIKLAFVLGQGVRHYSPGYDEIYTINADGTSMTALTQRSPDFPPILQKQFPTWSPDGTKVAFSMLVNSGAELWAINADGTGMAPMLQGGDFSTRPDWGVAPPDADADGVPDKDDNCPNVANPAQTDADSDGIGDSCDSTPNPGPQRGDYKNAAQFCKAEQAFWGSQFPGRYGDGANAYGKCVSQSH